MRAYVIGETSDGQASVNLPRFAMLSEGWKRRVELGRQRAKLKSNMDATKAHQAGQPQLCGKRVMAPVQMRDMEPPPPPEPPV